MTVGIATTHPLQVNGKELTGSGIIEGPAGTLVYGSRSQQDELALARMSNPPTIDEIDRVKRAASKGTVKSLEKHLGHLDHLVVYLMISGNEPWLNLLVATPRLVSRTIFVTSPIPEQEILELLTQLRLAGSILAVSNTEGAADIINPMAESVLAGQAPTVWLVENTHLLRSIYPIQ